jgi:hypothetical protein
MISAAQIQAEFGEVAEWLCSELSPTHVLVTAMDGAWTFQAIRGALDYLGFPRHLFADAQLPIIAVQDVAELRLTDEAWFPDMSGLAFLDRWDGEAYDEIPCVYAATNEFLRGRSQEPLSFQELEKWLSKPQVMGLLVHMEYLMLYSKLDLPMRLRMPRWQTQLSIVNGTESGIE